jgi:hypothetical protein
VRHDGSRAPEGADAAVVDVKGAEGGGRQAKRNAEQSAQDGLVRDHQVLTAGRLQHICIEHENLNINPE